MLAIITAYLMHATLLLGFIAVCVWAYRQRDTAPAASPAAPSRGPLHPAASSFPADDVPRLPHAPVPATLFALDASDPVPVQDLSRRLEQGARSMGIDLGQTDTAVGPTVTTVVLRPAPGQDVRKIVRARDAICTAARVEARVELRRSEGGVAFEVVNEVRGVPSLADVLPVARRSRKPLPIALVDTFGRPRIVSLPDVGPHILAIGTTGSGKSGAIHALVTTWMAVHDVDELHIVYVDPKAGAEFGIYRDAPHTLDVVDRDGARAVLTKLVAAMRSRQQKAQRRGKADVMDLAKPPPRIVCVLDEVDDLDGACHELIQNLARRCRTAGIHLFCATQYPTKDRLPFRDQLDCQLACRLRPGYTLSLASNVKGLDELAGNGDAIFQGGPHEFRAQVPWVPPSQREALMEHFR